MALITPSPASSQTLNRQGTLPFANFWVSTKPFGTPLGPYLLKWALTLLLILAPPAGDAFVRPTPH